MKTLIIYATKHGSAESCSKLLKNKLTGEVEVVNIKKDKVPDINSFDKVIIGGSIYAGRIQKEISSFCSNNLNDLKKKKLGLFICGMNKDSAQTELNTAFPQELLNSAISKECFGGEFKLSHMNMLERFMVKVISKTDKEVSMLSEENINRLAQLIDAA
jgi:menaquinone-dependent protoporphyrinogen oxidase